MQVGRSAIRGCLLSLTLGLAVVSAGAQGRGGGAAAGDLPRQVRAALAHGDLAGARQLAAVTSADQGQQQLALAIVDIFEGKDAEARQKLLPIAQRTPLGEAALELGLLDIRTGRREEGRARLEPIASVRSFAGPDDYFRLARAARGLREFLLANDAYNRIAQVPRADIQTEWADMFFERHRPGDAVTSYKQALAYDERWVPALVGLARALADEAPPETRKILEAAEKLAPSHPAVLQFQAEQHLDEGDFDAAKERLDRLAAAKPGNIDEIALRAAIAYKEQGIPAVEPIAQRVAAIDPQSGLAYRRAGEQAVRDYRFDDAAELARRATAIDATDPAAHFDLGLALLRTGDEAAARAALETSWDLDNSAPVTKNLLDLLDHLRTFEAVLHKDFIFKFAKEEAAVLKAYALPFADEAYATFQKRYGFTPKGPILIEVFPEHDDFAVRTLGLPGLVGALGACFGRVVTMDSPRARPPGEFSWQATLWHELAHVFTLQLSDYRVPRWLTEGVSVYEENRRQPAWGRELSLQFANALSKGQTFGVKKLPDAFKRPESLSLAYFEAALLVEHLVALNGESGLRTLLLAYADRIKDEEAFAKAFGRSIDEVEASFAKFVAERYGSLRDAMNDPPRQVAPDDLAGLRARAEEAPGNFVSQLAYGQALFKAGEMAQARTVLERAAGLAPQATGDASPRGLLAAIAETEKDTTRARRELRALLAHDHENVGAARKLAALARAANDVEEENYALRLVADLDPFDSDVHVLLGRRLRDKGDNTAAVIEFQAALALGPTNRAEAHTDLAEVLLKTGRKTEARTEVLAALKIAPTYARAQDLLLDVSGR